MSEAANAIHLHQLSVTGWYPLGSYPNNAVTLITVDVKVVFVVGKCQCTSTV